MLCQSSCISIILCYLPLDPFTSQHAGSAYAVYLCDFTLIRLQGERISTVYVFSRTEFFHSFTSVSIL